MSVAIREAVNKAIDWAKWNIMEPYINLPIFSQGTHDCDICFATRLIGAHTLLGVLVGAIIW